MRSVLCVYVGWMVFFLALAQLGVYTVKKAKGVLKSGEMQSC